MNTREIANIDFFKVDEYRYQNSNVCDFSNCPRPHFCMGLLLDGEADFHFYSDGKEQTVHVEKGDVIFVPITSRYKSCWRGTPDIRYISYHFCFASECGISERDGFVIQRVELPDFEETRANFSYAAEHYNGNISEQMTVMGDFYRLLAQILPTLAHKRERKYDLRIRRVMDYINLHSEEELSVSSLATMCNMSVSHFHAVFRKEVGMTPIDYKNRILVNHASALLLCREYESIEDISSVLGFTSSAYFRRVFKKVTGKSPSEYRRTAIEL